MEDISARSFEQVLHATVRMIRASWTVPVCLFIQMDDTGHLRVRAADGLKSPVPPSFGFKPKQGLVAQCLEKNEVLESSGSIAWDEGMERILAPAETPAAKKFVLVPVAGQSRTLGVLILGPIPVEQSFKGRENELRGAGNLCAVLSAYWRLYEWMNHFLPQINHELRTPLTAIQGSLGMVLGGVFGNVGTEVKAMLEMAHKGCERTVLAIEEYINQKAPDPKSKSESQSEKR
jgi:transcriptional regulator with GAF, ATPase, and Fis domain